MEFCHLSARLFNEHKLTDKRDGSSGECQSVFEKTQPSLMAKPRGARFGTELNLSTKIINPVSFLKLC